jgi:hypothetical protein
MSLLGDTKKEKSKRRPKIEKAQSGPVTQAEVLNLQDGQFKNPRDGQGFISTLPLPLKENGLIDWRQLISKDHIVLNKYNLAGRGESIDSLSEEDLSRLIDESPEEDLVIKLAGFRELARIRGFSSIVPELLNFNQESVTVKVTINWLPNAETPIPISVGAIANASVYNTDQTFSKFLETIAENRAFIRAVRHSLGIISLGQDEFKGDDVKAEAQNVKIQSLLAQGLEKAGLDLNALKVLVAAEGHTWNDKWVSVEKIDPAAAMSFIPLIKKLEQ